MHWEVLLIHVRPSLFNLNFAIKTQPAVFSPLHLKILQYRRAVCYNFASRTTLHLLLQKPVQEYQAAHYVAACFVRKVGRDFYAIWRLALFWVMRWIKRVKSQVGKLEVESVFGMEGNVKPTLWCDQRGYYIFLKLLKAERRSFNS